MTLQPDQAITPVGRLVSPATSLFTPPFGCTLLFAPDADFAQLDAVVRSVSGQALVLATVEDGSRLELSTEQKFLPVLDRSRIPVLDVAEVSKDAWARALVRVTPRGEIVLVAVQLAPAPAPPSSPVVRGGSDLSGGDTCLSVSPSRSSAGGAPTA